jgi:hypothetical protein
MTLLFLAGGFVDYARGPSIPYCYRSMMVGLLRGVSTSSVFGGGFVCTAAHTWSEGEFPHDESDESVWIWATVATEVQDTSFSSLQEWHGSPCHPLRDYIHAVDRAQHTGQRETAFTVTLGGEIPESLEYRGGFGGELLARLCMDHRNHV